MTFRGEAKCLKRTPMPPRPDAALMYCADVPEAPQPVDPAALIDGPADSFVPNPNRSWEQARRFAHSDLSELSDGRLWQERRQAEVLLAFLPSDDGRMRWIGERLRRLQAEQQRRRNHGRGG